MIEKILENLDKVKDFEKKGPNIENPSEKIQDIKLNYDSIYKEGNSKEISIKNYQIDGKNNLENTSIKGGSYAQVFIEGMGKEYEVHHMPADSVTPLSRGDGPAIRMETDDHRKTASCGSSREAKEYRALQKEHVDNGRFREALQMDIDDIKDKFGDKYNSEISEMLDYVKEIEMEGKMNA